MSADPTRSPGNRTTGEVHGPGRYHELDSASIRAVSDERRRGGGDGDCHRALRQHDRRSATHLGPRRRADQRGRPARPSAAHQISRRRPRQRKVVAQVAPGEVRLDSSLWLYWRMRGVTRQDAAALRFEADLDLDGRYACETVGASADEVRVLDGARRTRVTLPRGRLRCGVLRVERRAVCAGGRCAVRAGALHQRADTGGRRVRPGNARRRGDGGGTRATRGARHRRYGARLYAVGGIQAYDAVRAEAAGEAGVGGGGALAAHRGQRCGTISRRDRVLRPRSHASRHTIRPGGTAGGDDRPGAARRVGVPCRVGLDLGPVPSSHRPEPALGRVRRGPPARCSPA